MKKQNLSFFAIVFLVCILAGVYIFNDKIFKQRNNDNIAINDLSEISPQYEEVQPDIAASASIEDALEATSTVEIDYTQWHKIVEKMENCEVEMVLQKRDLTVSARLKNGQEIEAIEPRIDDILDLGIINEDKCGRIKMKSE